MAHSETSVTAVTTWGLVNCSSDKKDAIRGRVEGRGKEGGVRYQFMDIKTSPQQVRIIDYPANMRCNLNIACWFIVHRLILFSSVWCVLKSQCRSGEPAFHRSLLLLSLFILCLLFIRGWGGTIPSIRTWPSGSSSSALTTSEWYDELYHPVGGSTYYVSSMGHKSVLIYTF